MKKEKEIKQKLNELRTLIDALPQTSENVDQHRVGNAKIAILKWVLGDYEM